MTRPTNELEFFRRYSEYQGKQIDNSSLPVGAPMYYYCWACGILVAEFPEGWYSDSPPQHCESCFELVKCGSIDRLVKEAVEAAQIDESSV